MAALSDERECRARDAVSRPRNRTGCEPSLARFHPAAFRRTLSSMVTREMQIPPDGEPSHHMPNVPPAVAAVLARRALVTLILLHLTLLPGRAQSPEAFQKRRQAVREAMSSGSVLILRGTQALEEGTARQDSNLYYLTGIQDPKAALLLYAAKPGEVSSDDRRPEPRTEVLFLPAAGTAVPPVRTDFAVVRPLTNFQATLERTLLSTTGTIYWDFPKARTTNAPLGHEEQWIRAARDRGASFTLTAAWPLFAPLRKIKSDEEVAAIRTGARITAEALKEAMRSVRPGMFEYQVQSLIEHVFHVNGSPRPAFGSIIGSGSNSCIPHWDANTRRAEAGEVVVLDVGAEYGMYASDITRTIPVNGTFSRRQRDIYELVLKANEAAIALVGPGVDMASVNAKVDEVLGEGLVALGLLKSTNGLPQYRIHGLSHSIGLQVHDLGGRLTTGILKPGMVISIEPGLYLKEENLGVRIEDDVLITAAGREVLTASAPKTVAEIERLRQESGTDFTRYLLKP